VLTRIAGVVKTIIVSNRPKLKTFSVDNIFLIACFKAVMGQAFASAECSNPCPWPGLNWYRYMQSGIENRITKPLFILPLFIGADFLV
jgi:hypothetical protein